jgi:hypothetical protein
VSAVGSGVVAGAASCAEAVQGMEPNMQHAADNQQAAEWRIEPP